MRDVLIVRAPQLKRECLEELRDYVVESLHRGVLVVPEGMELEVLALPEPGEENAGPDASEEPSAVPTGRGAEEKRAIQEKLKAYRRAHGLGCFQAVAQAGLPEVTRPCSATWPQVRWPIPSATGVLPGGPWIGCPSWTPARSALAG